MPQVFLLFRKLQNFIYFIYVIFPYYFTTHLGHLHKFIEKKAQLRFCFKACHQSLYDIDESAGLTWCQSLWSRVTLN